MKRISQPNARILLEIEDNTLLKYIYDGYTYVCGYKPIRKEKARKKVKLEFHQARFGQRQRFHAGVGRLVQLDELVNAKTYREFEGYMKTMIGDSKPSYSVVIDTQQSFHGTEGLYEGELQRNFYRYVTENY